MNDNYMGYSLLAMPQATSNGRWSVAVSIKQWIGDSLKEQVFFDDARLSYILKFEAEKECINLGKNLIDKKVVRFD
jgi:hypothetical protein